MSVFRLELRRTVALWVPVAMLVVAAAFIVVGGTITFGSVAWNREWLNAVQWSRYLLIFLWPIIVGAAVLQGTRDARSGVEELFGSTPRPAGHRAVTLGLAVGLMAVAGYLVIIAAGAGQVVAAGGLFTTSWLVPIVLGVLSVVAGATLGLGLGRLLPYPVTAPASAVLAFVTVLLLQLANANPDSSPIPNSVALLGIAPAALTSPFAPPASSVQIGQLFWLCGLALTGFLLLLAGSVRSRLLALLPVAAGLAIALPVFPAAHAGNVTVDKAASALVCDGPVCVTRLHENWLSTVSGPAKEALQKLEKLPQHPSRFEESIVPYSNTEAGPRDPARLLVRRDEWSLRGKSGRALTAALLSGAGTPRCAGASYGGDKNDREDAARWVMSQWLLGSDTPPTPVSDPPLKALADPAWATLKALPEAEQTARVAAARQLELTCSGDPLKALTEGRH
ncbi:hypothetical protein [Amycolatopsis jejuensis]|uniref:hypothetical protein n=1 Tax=Amycolatopsis jejuensis TaxID=330084 RepID=UPI000525E919|nr:hypothetical protein [Amycolatopsis jejuensis]